MKILSRHGLIVAAILILAATWRQAAVAATDPLSILILKPGAQVSGSEIKLRDLVVAPATDFAGDAIICSAPDFGAVRVLAMSEVATALKKQGLNYKLMGPRQIAITRLGRMIVADDLRPLIEAALHGAQATAKLGNVELQANVTTPSEPAIVLKKLKFDPAIQKYRVWFAAGAGAHKISFEATATVEAGAAPLEVNLAGTSMRSAKSLPQVRRGDSATMELAGNGFSANVPVICLEDGIAGKLVRVRDKGSKRNYRAEVIANGMVRAVRQEN